jgi:hypothetical protein
MTIPKGAILLALAALSGLFAVFVATTGGIDAEIGDLPVRSRSWQRPVAIALLLALAGVIRARAWIPSVTTGVARVLPLALACWSAAAAVALGTFAAGGADSYGYISQAELLVQGRLTMNAGQWPEFRWPDVPRTLTPLGYTAGPAPGVYAPIYPPGLPLVMAVFRLVHPLGVFFVGPLCAAAAVWLCARLGREMNDDVAGAAAAVLLSFSPTFLFQSLQPMSDVPVTAAWMAALVLARQSWRGSAVWAGVFASIAILIRPNLAPLSALVIAASADARRLRGPVATTVAMIPGVALLCAIQYVRFGSPVGSGYGSFDQLFSLDNIVPNLALYPRWLMDLHTPFIVLWLLAPLWILRAPIRVRRFAWCGYAFCLAVVLAYLPYASFRPEEWLYTRFLLPAIPLMLLFGMLLVLQGLRRTAPRAAEPAALLLAAGLATWTGLTATSRGLLALRAIEQRYPLVGEYVRDHLPASAFVVAMQHSGSIRHYAGRGTLRWDLLDPASLDRAVRELRDAGHDPFLIVDAGEEADFRNRFAPAGQNSIDRLMLIATIHRTRVYRFQ